MKICSKCNIEKPSTSEYFYKDIRRKDGLNSSCKNCKKVYDAKGRSRLLQQTRDARRYQKSKQKPLARALARKQWGSANDWMCKVLGCMRNADELHHVDYSRPLDVIPLCKMHHELEHQNL